MTFDELSRYVSKAEMGISVDPLSLDDLKELVKIYGNVAGISYQKGWDDAIDAYDIEERSGNDGYFSDGCYLAKAKAERELEGG